MKVLKDIATISPYIPKEGNQLKLYQLAINGFTREEAKEKLAVTDKDFNNTYYQLKEYLSLDVINFPLSKLSRWQKIQCSIRRSYETSMMLLLLDKKAAGVPMARATIRRAEQYGLFQVAMDLCRLLVSIYGSVEVSSKLYNRYRKKLFEYQKEVNNEIEAERVFYDYAHTHLIGKEMEGIDYKLAQLDQIEAKSHRFHYMKYICRVMHLQVQRRDQEMINVCKEALAFFSQYKYLPYIIQFSFYYRSIASHLAQQEFAQAEVILNQSLIAPKRGGTNWQILMLHKALLGFHSSKHAIAIDAYRKAMKVPKKLRTEQINERWQIIRAYLEIFDVGLGKWRLAKFMNSFSYLPNDKRGPILSVHIIELIHLLRSGKLESYQYRSERLIAYIDRYLKKEGMERFVHFLRLLQCVVRGGFVRIEVQKKAKPYLIQLQQHTPRIGADVREVEVVPFERLWEMVLGWLK